MPPRSRFRRSARKQTGRARRAFAENTAPGHKLMDALGSAAYLFTLTTADLEPSLSDDPSGLYGDTVSALLAAVARAFHGPVYAVAEVGKGSAPGRRGRLHVHVVAHRDDGPAHVRRDTARCQPVYDVFGLYRYLAKTPEPYSLAAELDASAARVMRPSGRLPNTRRHFLSAERLVWAAAQCPKNQTPQPRPMPLEPNSPNTTPADPQTATAATRATTAPKTTSRPRPGPLSYHRAATRSNPPRAPPTARRPPTTLHPLRKEKPMTTATTSQTIAQLEARLADLDADRARTQTELNAARTELAAAHEAAQLADREPAAQAQLERLTPTLHARLAKAPQNSPTVRAIRDRLPTLDDANWSAADRLDMVRRLLDDLKNLDILDKNIWTSLEGAARKRNL